MSDFPSAGPEPRLMAREPWSVELDQVSATVQALQSAATLLQGAMQQRQGMWSEMRNAEQSLAQLHQQRSSAEHALGTAVAQLERTTREIEQVRAEQAGVLAEFDRLVQTALSRRNALVVEIGELEQRRDSMASWDSAQTRTFEEEPSSIEVPQVVPEMPAFTPSVVAATPYQPVFVASAVSVGAPPAPPAPPPATLHVPQPQPESRPEPQVVELRVAEPRAIAPVATRKRGWFGLRTVSNVLIGVLLLALGLLLTPVTQVAGGTQLLAVMSGSMEPVIHVGGIVAVRPVAVSELEVGDVITFANQANPDVLVTHRVVTLEDRAGQTVITTKGDANDTVDALTVSGSRPIGKVEFTLPWLGYLMVWLASPIAKVGILAIAVIGFAIPSTRRANKPVAAPTEDATYVALEREIEGLLPRAA